MIIFLHTLAVRKYFRRNLRSQQRGTSAKANLVMLTLQKINPKSKPWREILTNWKCFISCFWTQHIGPASRVVHPANNVVASICDVILSFCCCSSCNESVCCFCVVARLTILCSKRFSIARCNTICFFTELCVRPCSSPKLFPCSCQCPRPSGRKCVPRRRSNATLPYCRQFAKVFDHSNPAHTRRDVHVQSSYV